MMKKILMLFLSLAILTACSNDDDNSNGPDPIIGTWVLVQVVPQIVNFQECENESIITFNADNTAEGAFYLQENNCEASDSGGTWSRDGNTYTVEIPILGRVTGTVEFIGSSRFVFASSVYLFTFDRQ